jgi:SAM-dependent methyltransferase
MEKDWFEKWFDSPYYHLLYRDRDHREAEFFIRNLSGKLRFRPGSRILDMACGKGRHCIFLAKLGFDVTGTDISEQSITEAKLHERDNLNFYLHDMRKPFRVNYYDGVLNLFTSFGYFSNATDNQRVIRNAASALRAGGTFVLDFMNTSLVLKKLCPYEKKCIEGIDFEIRKEVRDGFIYKDISFTDQGRPFHFTERVQLLDAALIRKYFEQSGLEVVHLWGDYGLNDFNQQTSPRLILAGKRS